MEINKLAKIAELFYKYSQELTDEQIKLKNIVSKIQEEVYKQLTGQNSPFINVIGDKLNEIANNEQLNFSMTTEYTYHAELGKPPQHNLSIVNFLPAKNNEHFIEIANKLKPVISKVFSDTTTKLVGNVKPLKDYPVHIKINPRMEIIQDPPLSEDEWAKQTIAVK